MNKPVNLANSQPTLDPEATEQFPSAEKVYIVGSRDDIRVPMRKVTQERTHRSRPVADGNRDNPPIFVYDTSGPYTDPEIDIDISKGIPSVRQNWINERNDTMELPGYTSEYVRSLLDNPACQFTFPHECKPHRAAEGKCVTQMHYAKKGIITPEMEFIAIRENTSSSFTRTAPWPNAILGRPSALRSPKRLHQNLCARKSPPDAPSYRTTSIIPNPSR